jgi:type IV pilus assembly protein PilE
MTNRGFTLIEMMIVVAVIGILAAIAGPSYLESVRRSHRAEAKNFLQALAQRLEQNYGLPPNNRYDLTPTGAAVDAAFIAASGMNQVPAGAAARYNISFVAGQPTAATFVLQAVPVGAQVGDRCGVLLLNQQNLRGANNILNNRAALTLECWNR